MRSVHDLLTIVETALLKVYFIDNNKILVNALLHKEDNCCLASEVEMELIEHDYFLELISFYQKHNRHVDALQVIVNAKSLPYNDTVLNYLSKLNDNQLQLVFHYIDPIIKLTLQDPINEELLKKILKCFIGEFISTEPSIIPFNPMKVYYFLKNSNEDLAIRYVKRILPKLKHIVTQQSTNNETQSDYSDEYQRLSEVLNQWTKANEVNSQNNQLDNLQGVFHSLIRIMLSIFRFI